MKSLGHPGRSCHLQTGLHPWPPSHPLQTPIKIRHKNLIGWTAPRDLLWQHNPAQHTTRHGAAANGFASSTASSGSGSPMLQVLGNTRPVDRLRYQAKFVFSAMDTEQKGGLCLKGASQQFFANAAAAVPCSVCLASSWFASHCLMQVGSMERRSSGI